MTRENKLALIVGFSVILIVGVLVSDHFSHARQAQLRELNEQEIGAVGIIRAHEFTPSEPLVSTQTTPVAARPQASEPRLPNTPWSAPRSTGSGLIDSALLANSRNPRQPARQQSLAQQRATSARDSLRDSPLLIKQGRTSQTRSALASNAASLIDSARVHGVNLVPLTQPAAIAANTSRRATETRSPEPSVIPWEYHVRKDDSLYSIAKKRLGSGSRWREIRDLNADRLPNDSVLRIGLRLRMPADARNPTRIDVPPRAGVQPAQSQPRRTGSPTEYTVENGDTLGQISQRLLGTVKRMDEIISLNADKISNADEIREGMTLRIPAG